jgi:hypothetical protein
LNSRLPGKILIWDKTKKLVKIGPFHEYLKSEKHDYGQKAQ